MGKKNNAWNHYFRDKNRFADYPMRLFCVNEQEDFGKFQSEIRKVFRLLKCSLLCWMLQKFGKTGKNI